MRFFFCVFDNFLKGYEYRDAVDGRKGVSLFEEDGPFEYAQPHRHFVLLTFASVVLLDMSMPILDGTYTVSVPFPSQSQDALYLHDL